MDMALAITLLLTMPCQMPTMQLYWGWEVGLDPLESAKMKQIALGKGKIFVSWEISMTWSHRRKRKIPGIHTGAKEILSYIGVNSFLVGVCAFG